MGIFGRKPRLIDADVKNLSIEELAGLKGSLTAKLLIVGREMVGRFDKITELSAELADQESLAAMKKGANNIRSFNTSLEQELIRSTASRNKDP